MIVINRWINKLLFTLFVVFICNSAVAEWINIGKTENFLLFIDDATIRKNENIAKMWNMREFIHKQRAGRDEYFSAKNQEEYDCREGLSRNLYFSAHSDSGGSGQVLFVDDIPSTRWTPVVPGTVGERLWEIACGKV